MHIPLSVIIIGMAIWLFLGIWRPYRAEQRRLQNIRRGMQLLHPDWTPGEVESQVNLYRDHKPMRFRLPTKAGAKAGVVFVCDLFVLVSFSAAVIAWLVSGLMAVL